MPLPYHCHMELLATGSLLSKIKFNSCKCIFWCVFGVNLWIIPGLFHLVAGSEMQHLWVRCIPKVLEVDCQEDVSQKEYPKLLP